MAFDTMNEEIDACSVPFTSTSGKTKVNGETLFTFISALPHETEYFVFFLVN